MFVMHVCVVCTFFRVCVGGGRCACMCWCVYHSECMGGCTVYAFVFLCLYLCLHICLPLCYYLCRLSVASVWICLCIYMLVLTMLCCIELYFLFFLPVSEDVDVAKRRKLSDGVWQKGVWAIGSALRLWSVMQATVCVHVMVIQSQDKSINVLKMLLMLPLMEPFVR